MTQDELMHKHERIIRYLQTTAEIRFFNDLLGALNIILKAEAEIMGGYYRMARWIRNQP